MIIAFDLAFEETSSYFTIDSCTFTDSKAIQHGGSVCSMEKLDSLTNPGLIKLVMDLKSNTFIGSEANYNGTAASTGSGGVFYMKVESLDLLIKGGTY